MPGIIPDCQAIEISRIARDQLGVCPTRLVSSLSPAGACLGPLNALPCGSATR